MTTQLITLCSFKLLRLAHFDNINFNTRINNGIISTE